MKNNVLYTAGITNDNLINRAAASFLGAVTVSTMALRNKKTTKYEAFRDITKKTVQGTIATSSVIAARNYRKEKNGTLKALLAIGLGATSIYAIEVLDKNINEKKLLKKEVKNEQ